MEANERKTAKYSKQVGKSQSNEWRARCQPTEVGFRGFVGQSSQPRKQKGGLKMAV